MKNNHYLVEGEFIIHFSRIVSAKSESEAIRKARDFCVKKMKIKESQLDKNNVKVLEIN